MSNPVPSPPPAEPEPNSPPRIVIAGLGLLTPLGLGAWPTFAALLGGRRITDRVDGLEMDTAAVPLVRAIGGVTVARHTRLDPTVELAERAAREAATEAGVELRGLPTWLGTSKGAVGVMTMAMGVGSREQGTGNREQGNGNRQPGSGDASPRFSSLVTRHPSLAQAVALGPHGYLAHHLEQRTGLRVHRHAVAACASSLVALDQARRALLFNQKSALTNQKSDFALVLTAEAALLPLFIHSYRRLGVLAPLTIDDYRCAPLDASRNGFVLAEVGAAVILKRLLPGELPGAGEIELIDTATACEADDLLRPSRDMPALRHIAARLMRGHDIAALHPHAPGTLDHDPAELAALQDVLTSGFALRTSHCALPPVYAHKGALGHTLGSAGLVSLVLATLAARTGKLPPMPWLSHPITILPSTPTLSEALRAKRLVLPLELNASPALSPTSGGVHAVFAAGFGGHVAGATLRRGLR